MGCQLAVIGDVGGHVDELLAALATLDTDLDSLRLADGIVVCQVGDLVHRGPASDEVIQLVDTLMRVNGERWVQLAGNHEAQYLFPPRFQWHAHISPESKQTLRRWWSDGKMQLAAAFDTLGVSVRRPGGKREIIGAGGLLVTHAGLTSGLWHALGAPHSASEAAARINTLRWADTNTVWDVGCMLERKINLAAGVVWAAAGDELVTSWVQHGMRQHERGMQPSFHQAHGHTTEFRWDRGIWTPSWLPEQVDESHADAQRRISRIEVDEQVIWGCDPAHGAYAAPSWAPLRLPLA